jgi:hypothetical protein
MTMFETWSTPARFGELEAESFTWSAEGATLLPWSASRWAAQRPIRWVGEIKAHTDAGIRSGITQLGKRGANVAKVLVTYQKCGRNEVLVRATFPGVDARWFKLGKWAYDWDRMVPREKCLACLGSTIEGTVRDVFRKRTGLRLALKDSAAVKGPDLRPLDELAEFLWELSTELSQELAALG